MSRTRIAVAGLAAAATLTALVGCAAPEESAEELTLTIAVTSIVADGDWDILQGSAGAGDDRGTAFDTLMYWNADAGTGKPRLATGYTIADDRLSMELQLRDDVEFHDGTHFDAAVLETYLTALMSSEYVALGATSPYEPSFEATGDYTLEITTTKPIYAVDFLASLLGVVQIQSPAVLDDPEQALQEPFGSGPYLVENYEPEVERSYVRNPDYFDPEQYPYDRVVFKVFVDPTAALNALKSGQVDVAKVAPNTAAEAEAAGLVLHEGIEAPSMLIVHNPVESELVPLRDVRVRQAIQHAFDREAIAETILQGYGVVSSQQFTEGQPEWIPGGDERYGYDPELARQLMADAGYADGFDVTLPANSVITTQYEPIVVQALGDIGIRVTWEAIPDIAEWTLAELSGQYPLYLTNPDYAGQLRYITEEFPGYGRFVVPTQEVLDLVEDIKGADAERSAEASQELGEIMLEEAWFIPLTKPLSLWATDPEVDIDIDTTETIGALPGLERFRPAD